MSMFYVCYILYILNVNDKLKFHNHVNKKSNKIILLYLQEAEFGEVTKLERYIINFGLITVMVEGRRLTIYTFHLLTNNNFIKLKYLN